MKVLLSIDRIRSIVAGARTEKDIENVLRAHKIRFAYDTSPGFLSFRIPARSGPVLVYRVASRKNPFLVRPCNPAPFSFVPALHNDY